MRIGELARRLGVTAQTLRFYERRGLLPTPDRSDNGYREYAPVEVERLGLMIGLRQLDLPLDQAAELSAMCAAGRCDEVSAELKIAIGDKRADLRRRLGELSDLDARLAHLEGGLAVGQPPRPLISRRMEEQVQ